MLAQGRDGRDFEGKIRVRNNREGTARGDGFAEV
jgi:hypothetical protein